MKACCRPRWPAPASGVPVAASLAQSALALIVLLIFAAAAWNPTTDLFFFGTVSGGLGVLVLMTIAAVAVVRFFRGAAHGETRWRRRSRRGSRRSSCRWCCC